KERKPLLLAFRETPFHAGHIELMRQAARNGAIIAPPVPAFYNRPATIAELVDHTVGRYLDLLGFSVPSAKRWQGVNKN
ncbi:MAG: phenolic acid decarboxylase, partial [Acidaminococcales bacterium]|nr:phenolic acid decarboxylase [Acidaminococcales bacterium]